MKIVKNNKLTEIYIVIEENIIIKNAADFCLPYLMILYTDLKGGIYVRTQKEFWEDFDVVAVYTIPTTEEKSIRDMVSPEVLKKAKEFTEMIKDGTIKNRHASMYDNESMRKSIVDQDALNQKGKKPINQVDFPQCRFDRDKIEKYAVRERENNSLNEMKGTEKPSKERFVTGENKMNEGLMGGGHRVCEGCGKTIFGSVTCSCGCEYKKEVTQEDIDTLLTSKPQFTEEQLKHIFHLSRTECASSYEDLIVVLKKEGYSIIPVKSEDPLIVGNTMSYKGKNYLKYPNNERGCSDCAFICAKGYENECIVSVMHESGFVWKSFDDIIIDDSLACMRKDIGDIYLYNIEENIIDKLIAVDNSCTITSGWIISLSNTRLATAEELQEYLKTE